MPYTVPHTIAAGELVTTTTMNNEWGGNVSFLANPPACRVRRTIAQSIPNNAETALACDAERFDTDGMHDNATANSRITINTAGLYVVTAHVEFATNATGIRQIGIRVGGATYIALTDITTLAASPAYLSISTIWKFAVAEFLEAVVYQNSGGALNVNAGSHSPEFAAVWVGLG